MPNVKQYINKKPFIVFLILCADNADSANEWSNVTIVFNVQVNVWVQIES